MFKPKYNRTEIYDKERENNESKNSTTIVMKVSANKFRFSDANIGKIPRSEIRMKLWDSETNGLCIRVGSKKIFYVAKKKNGKDLYIRLGEFPYVTVEEARKEAHRVLAKISRDSNKNENTFMPRLFFSISLKTTWRTNNWLLFLLNKEKRNRHAVFCPTFCPPGRTIQTHFNHVNPLLRFSGESKKGFKTRHLAPI